MSIVERCITRAVAKFRGFGILEFAQKYIQKYAQKSQYQEDKTGGFSTKEFR